MNKEINIIESDAVINYIGVNSDLDLEFTIKENKSLKLNIFSNLKDLNINLKITNLDNSKFILNNSFINNGKYILNIETNLYGSNIENDVNIRGVNNQNGTVSILMNGTDAGETSNNVMNEYAKILNKSDYSAVLVPNLIVNTCNVTANHGVSIGSIKEDELFYMESKGINKDLASNLLEQGYILDIMDKDIKDEINKILNGGD